MLVSDWQLWAESKKALPNSHCSDIRVVPAVIWSASDVLMARSGCHPRLQGWAVRGLTHTHISKLHRVIGNSAQQTSDRDIGLAFTTESCDSREGRRLLRVRGRSRRKKKL